MEKKINPIIIANCADNGEFSHHSIQNINTGEILWAEIKKCVWTMEASKYKAHDYFYHTCHKTVPKHVVKDFKHCFYYGGKIEWK